MDAGRAAARPTHAYRGGYTSVPNWINYNRQMSGNAKRLLAALIHNEYLRTQPSYQRPALAHLAAWVGSRRPNSRGEYVATKQAVIDATQELEKWGLIRVVRRDRAKHDFYVNDGALQAGNLVTSSDQNRDSLVTSRDQDGTNLVTSRYSLEDSRKTASKKPSLAKPDLISISVAADEIGPASPVGDERGQAASILIEPTSPNSKDNVRWSPPVTSSEHGVVERLVAGNPDGLIAVRILVERFGNEREVYDMLRDAVDPGAEALRISTDLLTDDVLAEQQRSSQLDEDPFF